MQYTKKEFLKSLNCRKLNIHYSCNKMEEFGLADNFGTKYKLSSAGEFLARLRVLTKQPLKDVTYTSPIWYVGEEVEQEETVEDAPVEAPEQAVESVSEEEEVVVPR